MLVLIACNSDPAPISHGTHGGSSSGDADAGPSPPPPATTLPPQPPPPPPPVDECAGRRACDSFEGATVGQAPPAPWKPTPGTGGNVVVSTDRAYKGTKSVKVTTTSAQYQRAMIDFESSFGTDLYGRMMVWLEQPAADGVHWTMVDGVGQVPSLTNVTAHVRYGGQLQGKLMANYDTSGQSTDCWQHSATVMPIGKWVCFAFHFKGSTNEQTLAMDGADLPDLHVVDKGQGCIGNDLGGEWLAPTYAKASLGWESYQQDVGHTMYIDDVILDVAPVSCPPPP